MNTARITEAEVRPIVHRPETELLPARRCSNGHLAPFYSMGGCVVCAAERAAARTAAGPRARARKMRRHPDLQAARRDHEESGGWLLDLGDGVFGVTDSFLAVCRLRGRRWVQRCDVLQCWDEVELRLQLVPQLADQRQVRPETDTP